MAQHVSPKLRISRHFVRTASGVVHYRRAGSGPALVFVHGTPGSSASAAGLMQAFANSNTTLALDLPGWGETRVAIADTPKIGEFARVVDAWLEALGVTAAHFYGVGAGAWIALSLAGQRPDRVASLFLDEIEIHSAAHRAELRSSVSTLPAPTSDGSHLVEAFHRIRDRHLFRSRLDQSKVSINGDMASADALHDMAMAAWSGRHDCHKLESAVCAEDPLALHVPGLRCPIVAYTVLNEMPDAQLGAPLKHIDDLVKHRLHLPSQLAGFIANSSVPNAPENLPSPPSVSGRIDRAYVETSYGQIHLRSCGHPTGRPLVMIHSNPGGSEALESMMIQLGNSRLVIAPDMFGNGHSAKPRDEETIDIAAEATVMAEAVENLGLSDYDLWGAHTGAEVALEMSIKHPRRVNAMILDGLPFRDPVPGLLDNYFVSMKPDPHGTHFLKAWHIRRDAFLYWPWYNRTVGSIRGIRLPDPEQLHEFVMGFLWSGRSYHQSYSAAFRYRSRDRLPLVQTPTFICAGLDDMFLDGIHEAAALIPGGMAVAASTPFIPWFPNCPPAELSNILTTYQEFFEKVEGWRTNGASPMDKL